MSFSCFSWTTGLDRALQDVGETSISPCEMDHRQSNRDQDVQNCQSESHKAGAGPLPAQGEPLTVFIHC